MVSNQAGPSEPLTCRSSACCRPCIETFSDEVIPAKVRAVPARVARSIRPTALRACASTATVSHWPSVGTPGSRSTSESCSPPVPFVDWIQLLSQPKIDVGPVPAGRVRFPCKCPVGTGPTAAFSRFVRSYAVRNNMSNTRTIFFWGRKGKLALAVSEASSACGTKTLLNLERRLSMPCYFSLSWRTSCCSWFRYSLVKGC